jgi:hypothetical protein
MSPVEASRGHSLHPDLETDGLRTRAQAIPPTRMCRIEGELDGKNSHRHS